MKIQHVLVIAVAAVGLAFAGIAWSGSGHDHGAMMSGGGHESHMSGGTHEAAGSGGDASAEMHEGHSHEACELHGGQVTMTKDHHFETVFTPAGVQVYVYTAGQAPAMASKAAGTATIEFADGSKKEVPLAKEKPADAEPGVYFCPMHSDVVQMQPGECAKCGGMKLFKQDRLSAQIDLSKVEAGTAKATMHITGLKGDEPEVAFTETIGTLAAAPAPASDAKS
ncbi:MAG: heavy metal-binding domain-containing protein [Candidatus Eisenbacteria bacterium]|nr:heavy metal-binding domain-containing protein [Candidatus Eisenbacteria bacterium]